MKFELGKTYILDDIIPFSYQEYIYNYISSFPIWSLGKGNPSTVWEPSDHNEDRYHYIEKNSDVWNHVDDGNQMVHLVYHQDLKYLSPYVDFNLFFPILFFIQKYFNFGYNYFTTRCKINLQHPHPNKPPLSFCEPHIDHDPPNPKGYTIIYFPHNCDGDTVIFNETYNPLKMPYKNLTIKKRISPKMGRCILIPQKTFHSGSFPIKSLFRIVANFNINIT